MNALDPKIELVPYPLKSHFANVSACTLRAWAAHEYTRNTCAETIFGTTPRHRRISRLYGQQRRLVNETRLCVAGLFGCVARLSWSGRTLRDNGQVKGITHNGHIIRGLDDSPEKLYYRSVFLDCAQLAGIVMNFPEVDANRVGATGGSQAADSRSPVPRSNRASKKRRQPSRFSAIISACGKWTWRRTPTTRFELLPPFRPAPRARNRDFHPPRLH